MQVVFRAGLSVKIDTRLQYGMYIAQSDLSVL